MMEKREVFFKELELFIELDSRILPIEDGLGDRVYVAKRKIKFITVGGNTIEIEPGDLNHLINFNSSTFLIVTKNQKIIKVFWDNIIGITIE